MKERATTKEKRNTVVYFMCGFAKECPAFVRFCATNPHLLERKIFNSDALFSLGVFSILHFRIECTGGSEGENRMVRDASNSRDWQSS